MWRTVTHEFFLRDLPGDGTDAVAVFLLGPGQDGAPSPRSNLCEDTGIVRR